MSEPSAPAYDTDVVVVGSGFGGAVAALRLSEKGYRVTVLEAGRRFADEQLPSTSWDLKNYLWAPALGLLGIQRIHRLRHVVVLAGAGVGGGSLNYANTLYEPPPSFFQHPAWAHLADWQDELRPHYDQAARMLGVVVNPCDGPVEQLMAQAAADLGVADTLRSTPVGVLFGQTPGGHVPDPFFGGAGPARRSCTQCGSCMTGCRVGAKNTLTKNYLALAESAGAQIVAERTVTDVRPIDPLHSAEGYRVAHRRTGPLWRSRNQRTLTARFVVIAAGAWGTQTLLHDCRASGALPALSPRLGSLTRTNSEALLGATVPKVAPGLGASRGVAITRSFHPEPGTHVENVRYGRGSNAMGLLATLLVDGGPGRRWVRALGVAARHPRQFLQSFDRRRWSERTIIGLVMQSQENSLTLSRAPARLGRLGRSRLTSRQGHGAATPNWIPAGHTAVRALTGRLSSRTGQRAFAGGTLSDLFDIPMTAHFLGGVTMGTDAATGVIDACHRVHGYPGISVVDGSAVSANLGVNPSLTITALAERAFSLWPNKGQDDPRPTPGEAYRRPGRVWPANPVVPPGAPGELR